MAKKVKVTVKEDSGKTTDFETKTLTSLFNKLPAGTHLKVYMQENKFDQQFVGDYVTKSPPNEPEEPEQPHVCPAGQHWDETQQKCVPDVVTPPTPTCPEGQHWDAAQGKCVPDVVTPPPTGDVLYDSLTNSKLHDGIARTVTKEGSISSNGLGVECRASGDPRIRVNTDKTFSLLAKAGHGRFYGYVCNYNATLELECAFWNKVAGQDISLKMRSKHNENVDDTTRNNNDFGGYGWSADNGSNKWSAKREPFHNEHDQVSAGTMSTTLETQKYFKVEFTVKDEGTGVRQIVKVNGQQCMSKLDSSPKAYMRGEARYLSPNQSYFWVRSNIDSGEGELRIKRMRVLKA